MVTCPYRCQPCRIAGDVYHTKFHPPPGHEERILVEALAGDKDLSALTTRLAAYQERCDNIVRSFALPDDRRPDDSGEAYGDGTGDSDQTTGIT